MKTNNIDRIAVCPKCGSTYYGHPALSRTDNFTPICPDCGVREALDGMGVSTEEQESILKTIHRCLGQVNHQLRGGIRDEY